MEPASVLIEYETFTFTLRTLHRYSPSGNHVLNTWFEWYCEPWNRFISLQERDDVINKLVRQGYQFSSSTFSHISLYKNPTK